MVAISSQLPASVQQSGNPVPVAELATELRAVPEQETTINNKESSVSAPPSTQSANVEQPPQPALPAEPVQVVSRADQDFRRAAVEITATPQQPQQNQPVTPQPPPESRQVEARQPESQQQVDDTAATVPTQATLEAPPATPAVNTAAVTTYGQVRSLGTDDNQPAPRRQETTDSPATAPTAATQPEEQTNATQPVSTEREVFGGAIDAPRQ